ncbi:MAG: M28 family peptidase, partial [Caldilineaceae bacterium]|nr:M28 family peptidase [Caldilineaceae bacterium]
AIGFFGYLGYGLIYTTPSFSSEHAFGYVRQQIDEGPRVTGSEESLRTSNWLTQELAGPEWKIFIQPFTLPNGISARNIIGVYYNADPNAPVALLGAHYDTRLFADADSTEANRDDPPLGANSNASSVAVLLELARTLELAQSGHTLCLVFFDADDNDGIQGWEGWWGSRFFAQSAADSIPACAAPRFIALLDSVGYAGQSLTILGEDAALRSSLMQVASELEVESKFRNEQGAWPTPLQTLNVPIVTIAGTTYPYRHTLQDTLDKVSTDNLRAVGKVLESWLEAGAPF